jgi:uncharacterized RDD family membrane protein YckC
MGKMSSREPDGAPFNPYAPPATQPAVPVDPATADLAERGARLGAAIFDSALIWVALLPALVSTWSDFFARARAGGSIEQFWWMGTGPGQLAATFLVFALVALQSFLVATSGQSIGKRVARVRIVQASGEPAGFVRGVLLRNWIFHGLAYIPMAGPLLLLADVLFIFRDDRRCIHDLVADTKVIRA